MNTHALTRFTARRLAGAGVMLIASAAVAAAAPAAAAPKEWIDADTGHRVIRLSEEAGSASLYFHQNGYTPDGKYLIVTTASDGIAAIDLQTRRNRAIVDGPVRILMAGHKTGDVYYTRGASTASRNVASDAPSTVFATNIETGKTREIATLPARATLASLNADETLLLGSIMPEQDEAPALHSGAHSAQGGDRRFMQANYEAIDADGTPMTYADAKELRLHQRLQAIRSAPPREIYVLEIATGKVRAVHRESQWLNHLQFSPTDPELIMFCHEGPWHEVDRLWTIRTDGTGLAKVHTRTMNMEIWGHEFFSPDGRTIWYDLQTPRGEDFWLAGYEVESGKRAWHHLQRDEWSVHFNVSRDGKLFAGDGGDEEMVARAKDGKWIYLFRPEGIPDVAGIRNPDAGNLIDPGFLRAERLVNMSAHDYRLEPNVTFTPDGKWIVFRSNMHGDIHTYAVEVAKAQ